MEARGLRLDEFDEMKCETIGFVITAVQCREGNLSSAFDHRSMPLEHLLRSSDQHSAALGDPSPDVLATLDEEAKNRVLGLNLELWGSDLGLNLDLSLFDLDLRRKALDLENSDLVPPPDDADDDAWLVEPDELPCESLSLLFKKRKAFGSRTGLGHHCQKSRLLQYTGRPPQSSTDRAADVIKSDTCSRRRTESWEYKRALFDIYHHRKADKKWSSRRGGTETSPSQRETSLSQVQVEERQVQVEFQVKERQVQIKSQVKERQVQVKSNLKREKSKSSPKPKRDKSKSSPKSIHHKPRLILSVPVSPTAPPAVPRILLTDAHSERHTKLLRSGGHRAAAPGRQLCPITVREKRERERKVGVGERDERLRDGEKGRGTDNLNNTLSSRQARTDHEPLPRYTSS
ncbi:hypothetical protein WMY93_008124 [Mugilogobius chulae]|uniref:Uncharacterized protein n=1 Tax=Mugilogobius chulae TaxID=88201 RepID=A0AAW0PTN2_9GOBI